MNSPAAVEPRAKGRRFLFTVLAFAVVNLVAWVAYHHYFGPGTRRILRVDRFSPGESAVVGARPVLEWRFNLDVATDTAGPPAVIQPAVDGEWRWRGARDLLFQPRQDLPRATNFTVTIPAERLRTPEGFALPAPFVASVRTEPLRVVGVRQGGIEEDHRYVLEVEFNDSVLPADVAARLKLTGPDDKPLGFRLHGEAAGRVVRVLTDSVPNPAKGDGTVALKVHLDRGLAGMGGPLGLEAPFEERLTLGTVLAATDLTASVDPRTKAQLFLRFNGDVETSLLRSVISVEPAVPFVINTGYRGVTLDGDFRPATRYAVRIAPAPKGADARLYPRPDTLSVFVPDRGPAAWFEHEAGYLGSKGNRTLLAHAVNRSAVSVRLWRVYDDNLVQWRNGQGNYAWQQEVRSYGRPVASRTIRLKNERNVVQDIRVSLDDLFAANDTRDGVYRVTLCRAGEREPESRDEDDRDEGANELGSSVVTLSDIALTAKREPHGLVVWATSLGSAAPLKDVRVRLYSNKNQPLGEVRTDADGLARFESIHPAQGETPAVLLADRAPVASTRPTTQSVKESTEARDLTWMDLRTGKWDMADADVAGRPYPRTGQEAFVYTDRGVYRPGETVHLRAIVRSPDGTPPKAMPARWLLRRPDMHEWKQELVTLDADGAAGLDLALPDDLTTGRWTAELGLPGEATAASTFGSVTFQVEEYVPNRLKVVVGFAGKDLDSKSPSRRGNVADESLRAVVQGDYLFGRPAAGLQARVSPRLTPVSFQPSQWSGWTFNDSARVIEYASAARAGVVPTDSGDSAVDAAPRPLDGAGHGEWSLRLKRLLKPAGDGDRLHYMGPWRLSAEATVQEPAGRSVTAASAIEVDALAWYIGVRQAGTSVAVPGQPVKFDVALVSPAGKPANEERTLDVALLRESWNNSLTFRDGRYRYESHRLLEPVKGDFASKVTTRQGRADLTLTPPSARTYVIRIRERATGALTSVAFLASDGGAWDDNVSREHPEHLDLIFLPPSGSASTQPSDQKVAPNFKVGQTARVLVRSPFAGRLLLTVETDRVVTSRVIEMKGSTIELPVEVTEALRPNAYVSATVVRAVDPQAKWRTHRAHGTVRLVVDPADHRLAIDIQTPAEVRPLSPLDVELRVTDAQGQPVKNVPVTVAAVDEGILQLTWFRTPDPLAFFHAPRALGVESLDLYGQLMPEVPRPEGASAVGGDRGATAAPRYRSPVTARRVKSVALFTTLRTDDRGVASTHLSVPEFSGQLRIMAVAHSGAFFGAAQRDVHVRSPLLVQSSFPRFAAPGDQFSVPVTLFNNGKTDLQVSLTAELQDAAVKSPLAFATTREAKLNLGIVPIKAGGQHTLMLPCVASDRVGVARVRLTATAGGETSVENTELPIRPPSPFVTTGGLAILTPAHGESISLKDEFFAGTEQTTVSLTPLPSLRLPQAIDYLERYPYGCAEQTISTSFALLYLDEIGPKIAPGVFEKKRVAEKVQAGILRLLGMQTADGGIAMWPGNRESWPWASIYAAHFLVETRAAGHAVPPDFENRLLGYVRTLLNKAGDGGELLESQAYAAYVLALTGKPDRSFMNRLTELTRPRAGAAEEPAMRAQARLYLSLAFLASGRSEVASDLLPASIPPLRSGRQGGGNVGSPIRDRAMYLNTLLSVRPDDPALPAQAAQLAAEKWQTTQETTFAAMAIGKYLRHAKDQQPYDRAELKIDGQTVTSPFTTHTSARELIASVSGPAAARGYLSWTRTGVPRVMPPSADHGIKIRRRYLDEKGKPLASNQVQSGDLILVEITIESASPLRNLVVEDLLPAGLEVENPRLKTTSPRDGQDIRPDPRQEMAGTRVDVRDDRMIFYGDLTSAGVARHVYATRAVVPGRFALPPVRVESMYEPEINSLWGPGGTFEVRRLQGGTLVEIPAGE